MARNDSAKVAGPMHDLDDRDFVITRVFAAPRALVWKAWTEKEHLTAWWGPRGFSNRVEADVRPGGAFRIVMVGPDGTDYPMTGIYREVAPPERLVYTTDLSEQPEAWFDAIFPQRDKTKPPPAVAGVTTVTFEALGESTRLTVWTRFEPAADRAALGRAGLTEGRTQSLERLEALLGEGMVAHATEALAARG